jgi:AcrR family transcriptional regulator
MARPKVPLISRRAAVEAALQLIDTEGLEAFSIRRLGAALGVNGASLYHHFADKDEILTEVVRLVLSELRIPRSRDETWQSWFVAAATAYRAAVLAHPNIAPLLVSRRPRMYGQDVWEYTAELLTEGGVPASLQLAVMDASEMLAFASALFTISEPQGGGFGPIGSDMPALGRAVEARTLDDDSVFRAVIDALAAGIEAKVSSGEFSAAGGERRRPARRVRS